MNTSDRVFYVRAGRHWSTFNGFYLNNTMQQIYQLLMGGITWKLRLCLYSITERLLVFRIGVRKPHSRDSTITEKCVILRVLDSGLFDVQCLCRSQRSRHVDFPLVASAEIGETKMTTLKLNITMCTCNHAARSVRASLIMRSVKEEAAEQAHCCSEKNEWYGLETHAAFVEG
jgi:hypothetical protein